MRLKKRNSLIEILSTNVGDENFKVGERVFYKEKMVPNVGREILNVGREVFDIGEEFPNVGRLVNRSGRTDSWDMERCCDPRPYQIKSPSPLMGEGFGMGVLLAESR